MAAVTDRVDAEPERLWLATFGVLTAALAGGSLLFRERVWDRFLWQYFWGPVAADGNGAVCAVNSGSGVEYLASTAACTASEAAGEIVAYPGYTLVSEVGYILILLFALVGVYLLLDRLEIGDSRELFYALVPFILFGGALRTVEDTGIAALETLGGDHRFVTRLGGLFYAVNQHIADGLVAINLLIAGKLSAAVQLQTAGVVINTKFTRGPGPFTLGIHGLLVTFIIQGQTALPSNVIGKVHGKTISIVEGKYGFAGNNPAVEGQNILLQQAQPLVECFGELLFLLLQHLLNLGLAFIELREGFPHQLDQSAREPVKERLRRAQLVAMTRRASRALVPTAAMYSRMLLLLSAVALMLFPVAAAGGAVRHPRRCEDLIVTIRPRFFRGRHP